LHFGRQNVDNMHFKIARVNASLHPASFLFRHRRGDHAHHRRQLAGHDEAGHKLIFFTTVIYDFTLKTGAFYVKNPYTM
jgi:hypothetical protein